MQVRPLPARFFFSDESEGIRLRWKGLGPSTLVSLVRGDSREVRWKSEPTTAKPPSSETDARVWAPSGVYR